ncbi:MAG: hypothetical protein R3B96_02340 [Pirellulaceae bacterium]
MIRGSVRQGASIARQGSPDRQGRETRTVAGCEPFANRQGPAKPSKPPMWPNPESP